MHCMPSTRVTPEPRSAAGVPPLAELAIVVVTWSSAEEMPALLASLRPVLAKGAALVVVENASGDETPAVVRATVPPAHVIENDRNRGFASAANQGLAATVRPFVLFLNPDVIVHEGAIERALAFAAADPTIAVLGCRTVDDAGCEQPTVDRFHSLGGLVREAVRDRRFSARPRGTVPARTTDVDWVYGSFLLCRRDVLVPLGGFDERYFMYGEDLDLCRRVHDGGWRVVYYSDATIVHYGNRSGARRYGEVRDAAVLAGTLRFFRLYDGRASEWAFRLLAGASFAPKALVWAVRGWSRADPDAERQARVYRQLLRRCIVGLREPSPRAPEPAAVMTDPRGLNRHDRVGAYGGAAGAQMKARGNPQLSIVILTWDSRELLADCLAALPPATVGLDTEIIIVDNGSRDGTAAFLAQHPECVVIRNRRNRGVAPARNQGLRAARGDFVALLDVDTVPEPEAFRRLLERLEAADDVGVVGPRLVGADGSLQYSCRRFPTAVDKILRRLPERWGRAIARDVELRWWDHASVRRVDYVIGACQVIRASALQQVGLLDERIFYGPEDVDLCLRMYRGGWGVEYVPQATVAHLERRVTRRLLSVLTARHVHGLGYFFWKHRYLVRRPCVRVAP